MSRAPFQALVFPYRRLMDGDVRYAVFQRDPSTGGFWQGVSGGGEDAETPLEAARREAWEEAGIDPARPFMPLQSMCMIPAVKFGGFRWGPDVLLIPEHAFGVEVNAPDLTLSHEHTQYRWVTLDEGTDLLLWDSNKVALWELDQRLSRLAAAPPSARDA